MITLTSGPVALQAGVPVCEYQLEADSLADVVARARELLGSRVIAEGTVPAGAEEGTRLQPPGMPWAPLQEQVRSFRKVMHMYQVAHADLSAVRLEQSAPRGCMQSFNSTQPVHAPCRTPGSRRRHSSRASSSACRGL